MPKLRTPDQPYAGRRMDAVVINVTLENEAVEFLRRYCPPGQRTMGRFLSRLIFEHEARQEERQRLRQEVVALCENEVV
jgi:hypothetical protein